MTLLEFLAANPEVKAELDQLLEDREKIGIAKGKKDGKAEAVAIAENVFTFMKAGSPYLKDEQIQKVAVAVLKGEQPQSNLDMAVTTYDMLHEKDKSEDGKGKTKKTGETPPDAGLESKGDKGKISDEESLEMAIKEEGAWGMPGARKKVK
jgi:predicted aconitase